MILGRLTLFCAFAASSAVAPGAIAAQAPVTQTAASPQDQQPAAPPSTPVDLLWRTDEGSRFSLLGIGVGSDQDGGLTFDGRGRFFAPFGRRSAVQIDGSYDWYHQRREGQLDLAVVNRTNQLQFGLFSSVRFVNIKTFDSGGHALSQAGVTLDYILPRGRIGAFGTAALKDRAILGRQPLRYNVFEEGYLRLVDQFGASGHVQAFGDARLEGQLAILKPTGQGRTTGGSLRFVYPIAEHWALTGEAAWNPYVIARSTQGRFTVGVRMLDRPSESDRDVSTPTPIEIPAIRYQLLTREARTGNDPPIADAGPDQTIVVTCQSDAPCLAPVVLSALGSRDPEGDPLTFTWTSRSGFTDETFTAPTDAVRTAFVGKAGETYVLRLQVTDDRGATAFDEVVIVVTRRLP